MCSIAIYASFIFPGKKGAGRLLFLFPFLDGFIRQGVLGAGARAVGTGGTVLSRAGGVAGFLLTPLERREPWPARPGPSISWEEMERTPGRRFLQDPSLVDLWGELYFFLGTWPAASRPTPHGPPTGSGRQEEWFVDGGKSGNPQVYSLPSPKGYPSTSQPAQLVGGPLRALSMRRPQARYADRRRSPLLLQPGEKGCGKKTLSPPGESRHSPWCFLSLFLQNRAPPGGQVPARSNGDSQTEKPTQQAAGHPLTRET